MIYSPAVKPPASALRALPQAEYHFADLLLRDVDYDLQSVCRIIRMMLAEMRIEPRGALVSVLTIAINAGWRLIRWHAVRRWGRSRVLHKYGIIRDRRI